TTGTAPQSASRKIRTASRTELKTEQVRGLAVITSATVRVDWGRSVMGKDSSKGSVATRYLIFMKFLLQVSDQNRKRGIHFAVEPSRPLKKSSCRPALPSRESVGR